MKATIATATANLRQHLEHFSKCESAHDLIGMHYARTGIRRCLCVIRVAKTLSANSPT
jgi:hypothetical protein